jgi:hypothetical protein
MQSLLVSYDLDGRSDSSENYEELISAIKNYGYYAKLMLSTWIVVTELSAESVRDDLRGHMHSGDRLFVGPIGKPSSWTNLMATKEWMEGRP